MLHKPRTKLKKRYYRNKGNRYYLKNQTIKRNNHKLTKHQLKIFCNSQTIKTKWNLKGYNITINKPLFNKDNTKARDKKLTIR